jgi:hypothetical protein
MCIRLKEDFKVADRLLEAQNIKELIDAMRLALGNKGELVDAAG